MLRSSMWFAVLLCAGASALGCGSLGRACTEIGCIPGTPLISISGANGGPVPPGTYEFRVTTEAGAEAITCDLTDPMSPTASCTNAPSTSGTVSGGVVDISASRDPKTIRVFVMKDGTEIAARTFTATYEDREINGPGCGTCRLVSVTPDPKIVL
jgi:hypothetical protein